VKKLKKINKEYTQLKMKSQATLNEYFSKSKNETLSVLIDPKWKEYKAIEKQAEEKIEEFISEAKKYLPNNKLLINELVINITDEILQEIPSSIDIFLLINLLWKNEIESDEEVLNRIESLVLKLTKPEKIIGVHDYYIEMLIDWLNYNEDKPINLEILKKTLLIKYESEKKYGSYVKAIGYLNRHSEEDIKNIHELIRKTEKYKTDSYYRDWIEEEE